MSVNKSKRKQRIMALGGTLAILGFFAIMINVIRDWIDSQPTSKKVVQEITLITPPPPPPKIEEPPPEPPPEEQVEIPEPEALPDEPAPEMASDTPPMDQLGMDAEGGAGDAFGLVGRKGGRGLLEGNPFAWYSGQIQQSIHDVLAANSALHKQRYTAILKLWMSQDGRVNRLEIVKLTGDSSLGPQIKQSLSLSLKVVQAPPEGMPQPIKLRIANQS